MKPLFTVGASRTRSACRFLAAFLVAVVTLSACGGNDPEVLAGYERSPAPDVAEVSLPAVNRSGESFTFQAEPGGLLLVYFGFANCPDICPTTLADARLAIDDLGARADDVGLAFITIDPDRDNAEDTANYAEAFVDGAVALRTEDAFELQTAADAFGVSWQIEENDQGEIEVGHTSHLFVVDDDGRLQLSWQFGVPPEAMTRDLLVLFERQEAA